MSITEAGTEHPAASAQLPLAVIGVMAFVFALRLLHLSSALVSPLSYQLGPDEDYYWRFAHAVASGVGQNSAEFTFMDPGYGYLLGGMIRFFGANILFVFAVQCLVDTLTAAAIWLIGRKLGRERAGLIGAMLYGATSLALMFSCAVLKEVWVASLFVWWIFIALHLRETTRLWGWFAFGVFCGLGVALRSTFLLLAVAAAALPLFDPPPQNRLQNFAARAGLLVAGLLLALLPWSVRNLAAGTASPLPHNSGIVLHQVYNADNPDSSIWIPPFVNYLQPSEIWRGYSAEAQRRSGRSMSPAEVDAYWKAQALSFIESHPGQLLGDGMRKARSFFAASEIPINRSLEEEGLFSPVLRALPKPAPWLLALGLCGLVWFARSDRRWLLLAAPLAMGFLTFIFFWAEDRFRFHVLAIFALSAGLGIDMLLSAAREKRLKPALGFAASAAALCLMSFGLGGSVAARPLHWDQIVWGYIKMGRPDEALSVANRVVREQPDNAPLVEALGYLSVLRHDYSAAALAYGRAAQLRPRSDQAHFNLAKALLETGDKAQALKEAHIAWALNPDPAYKALLAQLENPP
jgi:tetratricopeptide (TPR) repeat protein